MAEQQKQADAVSTDIQEVMRGIVTAIRAVKLYPPNNPVYSQSIQKAFEVLTRYLDSDPRYPLGVQKTYFLFEQLPIAKETQMNKPIAQDLFAKGIREIVFHRGIEERELSELFKALSFSAEELAMRSGIVSILWEKGSTHIKVAEAALEDVIVSAASHAPVQHPVREKRSLPDDIAKEEFAFTGRTLMLGDLIGDPGKFSQTMLELAHATANEDETVEDRLHTLYQEAGRKLAEEHPEQSEALFDGLAESVLELDQKHRDRFINGKLYGELDAESVQGLEGKTMDQVPDDLHEVVTGRFTKDWTVQQVAELLKKAAKRRPPSVAPADTRTLKSTPLSEDLPQLAKELSEYTTEEMESLKIISDAGMESDIIEAAVRTLIFLLPLAKNPTRNATEDKETALFGGVIHQVENMLGYLFKLRNLRLALLLTRALQEFPAPPEFQKRIREAIKKTASKDNVGALISIMRANPKSSPAYEEAHTLVKIVAEDSTPVLLEMLATEQDRAARLFLVDLLKEIGRSQIQMIARGLNDNRWYVVRNVVNILAESNSDQTISFLEKVADHKNTQIRQSVIKGLIGIGGRRAASVLARYLHDREPDIQFMSIKALSMVQGAGADEAQAVMDFLAARKLSSKQQENELLLEAARTLGKIGRNNTVTFLARYNKVRWWRSRKPQEEMRKVAQEAAAEIKRRMADGGRTK